MRIFVSAGEVSGDIILSRILRPLRERFPGLELCGFGGDASASWGLRPLLPLSRMAINGAGDVLHKAFFCLAMYRLGLRSLERFRPDLVLLVDYPGLNLRLARKARRLAIPVYYVAPPQAWAYRNPAARLRRISRALAGATVHVLFPFEAAYYGGTGSKVLAGHFLEAAGPAGGGASPPARPLLCLCPGSRVAVLRRNLPAWLRALSKAGVLVPPGAGEVAVLVPPHLEDEARNCAGGHAVRITSDKAAVLAEARWAIAFPGTITLELVLHRIPVLMLALLDPLTLALGRRAVRMPWLGLPNLLLGEGSFPEWAGTSRTWNDGDFPELWARLRDGRWDWVTLLSRLRQVMGAGQGAPLAAAECAKILEES